MTYQTIGTVEAAEPLVKSGSSADMTSFDDLENLPDAPAPSSKAGESKKKVDSSSKKESKQKEESDDSSPEEESPEDSESKKERSEDNGKDKEKKLQDTKTDKEKVKENQQHKLIKVKSGDQEFDLRLDTPIEVTVDGKKESVPIQELLNNYSGKTNWGKKFEELDKEKKSFQSERQELQGGIDKILDLTKTDQLGAVEYFYNILGQDGREVIKGLKSQINAAFEEWSQLSPEERAQREIQDESDYHKRRADRYEAESTRATQKRELDTRVEAIQKKHSLDNRQFVSRYDELNAMKASGKLQGDITPELVGIYHQEMVHNEMIDSILNEVNPELEGKEAAFNDLKGLWIKDPDLTSEQIKKIAADVYGSEAARKLAKKLKKSQGGEEPYIPPTKSKNHEPTFFDDLE